ncbi:response regulator [Haematospirillum jordaniae]|uniref:PAS domain-containing hybrid sensor histidine kinase/response regulator n=1 Tax=Haematospirillum jordaniae TaxID=1549855 RepID=UPI00143334E4|nr:ATP-binding protein [Haematospirillum jordaniae]NKD44265.1 response regulator [Haematospirillum jordaniae]NKD91542.1 response regulator [Haematospirillum jordaniae]
MLPLRLGVYMGGRGTVFWFVDVGEGAFPSGNSRPLREHLLRRYLSGSIAARVLANIAASLAVIALLFAVPVDMVGGILWGGSVLAFGLFAVVWRIFWRARLASISSALLTCEVGLSVLAVLQGLAWGSGIVTFGGALPGPEAFLYLLVLVAVAAITVLNYAPLPAAMFGFASGALFFPAAVLAGDDGPILPLIGLAGIGYGIFLLAGGWARYRELVHQYCINASHRDVSERLAEHEVRHRSVLEYLPELVVVLDADLRITFHSAASGDLFGYPPGTMQGMDLLAVIAPADRSRLHCALHGLFLDPEQTFAELIGGLSRDERSVPLSLRGRAIPGVSPERRPQELVITLRDATRRLHVEETLRRAKHEAEAAGKARSDFLAMISHEIRTPMSGILGLVDLLSVSDLTEAQREHVRVLQRACDHLLDLLTSVLDFSRIEARGIRIEAEPFDLRRVVGAVTDMFRGEAKAKGIQMRAIVAPELPATWVGDSRCLRQILANLVGNAVKFTQVGHVEVRVRGSSSGDHRVLCFDVEDTGVGIAQGACDSIFDPFVQANRELIGKSVGSGLGLAISRRLVTLLGGKISVSSTVGQGSVFSFTIPLSIGPQRVNLVKDVLPVRMPRIWERAPEAIKVLVVDDSDLNRLVTCEMLNRLGFCVVEARNGAESIDCLQSRPEEYHLVFMDIQMPQVNGIEAVRRIRFAEQCAGRQPVPVVAVSASSRDEDREAALEAGCCAYVIKPLRREQLLELLDRFLSGNKIAACVDLSMCGAVSRLSSSVSPSFVTLLPGFLEAMQAHIAELRQMVIQGRSVDVVRISHAAKGNAMLLGCPRLVEALRRLEDQGRIWESKSEEGYDEVEQSFMQALVEAVEREVLSLEHESGDQLSEAIA